MGEGPSEATGSAEDTGELNGPIGRIGVSRRVAPPGDRARRRALRRLPGLGCLVLFAAGVVLGAAVGLSLLRRRGASPAPAVAPPVRPQPATVPPAPSGPRIVFAQTRTRPEKTPDVLEAGAAVVYCFFDVPGRPATASASGRWRVGGVPAAAKGDTVKEAGDHLRGYLALRPPDGKPRFAEGLYELELLVEGEPVVEGSFALLKGAAGLLTPPKGMERFRPEVKDLVISAERPGAARRPPFVLPANVARVVARFRYRYALPGAAFLVFWTHEGGLIAQATSEVTIVQDAGVAEAWFAPKAPARLPVGRYGVIVSLGEGTPPLAQESFWVGRQPRREELSGARPTESAARAE